MRHKKRQTGYAVPFMVTLLLPAYIGLLDIFLSEMLFIQAFSSLRNSFHQLDIYYSIQGDSMYPAMLPDDAWIQKCPLCGYIAPVPYRGMYVCENCRWMWERQKNDSSLRRPSSQPAFRRGADVDIYRKPVFGDCVVARPNNTTGAVIKRVWGLPGDSVEIRHGCVFVNGARPALPLRMLEETRILVNNDHYRKTTRWMPDGDWEEAKIIVGDTIHDRWRCVHSEPGRHSRLTYEHMEGRVMPDAETGLSAVRYCPTPITNQRSINGTQMRSEWIRPVQEMMLCFRVYDLDETGVLEVRLPALGGAEHFHFARNAEAFTELRLVKSHANQHFYVFPAGERPGEHTLTVSTLDGVPRVWWGDELLPETHLGAVFVASTAMNAVFPPNTPQFSFLGGGTVTISRPVLYRGEYYLKNSAQFVHFDQNSLENSSQTGYYLLGDNSYISEDSRAWGRVPDDRIIGTVLKRRY